MRTLIYKDVKIPQNEYEKVLADYAAFILKHTGVVCTFWTEPYDYTDYPTVLDTDGDDVLRQDFLHEIAKEVTKDYGNYGVDNVITLIHADNWKSGKTPDRKGIWGTNYSYKYGNYNMQYARWDAKNQANTFGTIYHEIFHTYDALVKVETGVDLNPILGVKAFDAGVVHGGEAPHKYIRYNENTAALQAIAPYIAAAYAKRKAKHEEYTRGLKKTAISLLESLVTIWRQKLYQKNGNPK